MSYEDEDLDTTIRKMEKLAEVRDKELYKGTHTTFEEFLEGNGIPLEQAKSALRLVDDPLFLGIREAARIIMDECGLSFEAAVEQVGDGTTPASRRVNLQALLVIRDHGLYRRWFASFEDYLRECYCNGDEDHTQIVLDALQEFPPPEVAGQRIKA